MHRNPLYPLSLSIIHVGLFTASYMGERRTGTLGDLATPIPGKRRRSLSRSYRRRAEHCRRITLILSKANCPFASKRYYGEVMTECVNMMIYSNTYYIGRSLSGRGVCLMWRTALPLFPICHYSPLLSPQKHCALLLEAMFWMRRK